MSTLRNGGRLPPKSSRMSSFLRSTSSRFGDQKLMVVRKRDGRLERVRVEKITHRIEKFCYGLDTNFVDVSRIVQRVHSKLYSGVSTSELDNEAAETCHMLSTDHPDYSILAARIFVSNLHRETKKNFSDVVRDLYNHIDPKTKRPVPLVNDTFYNNVMLNKEIYDSAIVHDRDNAYTYFGLKTLARAYLKDIDGKIVETPQQLLMRIAVALNGTDTDEALELYEVLSQRWAVMSTPIQFNAGQCRQGLTSCFLKSVTRDTDSIAGIYDYLKEMALISSVSGGIGASYTNIRGHGALIRSTGGTARGIPKLLTVVNSSSAYVTQSDKRKGSIAIFVEPWHCDIEEILKLKEHTGAETERARTLFYGLWVPDLFMEKVLEANQVYEANQRGTKVETDDPNFGKWCLFSPDEAPNLVETYGDAFKELYRTYEDAGLYRRQVDARSLFMKICESQIKTGGPYMMYKDACNRKNNQAHIGTLTTSNLCCEILEYCDDKETACCNLASIGLGRYVYEDEQGQKQFDFEQLHYVAGVLVKNLNRVINVTQYPSDQSKFSNMRHRPLGIGVSGLADTYCRMRIPFSSPEAHKLNKTICETIYHGALTESIELAKRDGPYESFQGSNFSKGKFQFDLWEEETGRKIEHSGLWDWEKLRQDMLKYGVRNSLLTAYMPTASTSQIIGYSECFEPFNGLLYLRKTLAGEVMVVNELLLKDLCDLGLWNEDVYDQLVDNKGSIQNIACIPDHIKELYQTSFDIKQMTILNQAAERAPYIDQSQSMNIFMLDPTYAKLTTLHFKAWERKLKTGLYYLKMTPAVDPLKMTTKNPIQDSSLVSPSPSSSSNLPKRTIRTLDVIPDEMDKIHDLHNEDYQPKIGEAFFCKRGISDTGEEDCLMCSS